MSAVGTSWAEAEVPASVALGRRSPRGTLRWYLVHVPEGREQSTCKKVRSIIPEDILEEAFVPRKEHWFKHGSEWTLRKVPLFKGYFVAVTKDAPALSRALSKLSFPVQLAGAMDRGYMPLAYGVQEFLSASMDEDHVIRNSTGEIVNDCLHVLKGPLAGQESRVRRVNRHMRRATVRVCDGSDDFLEVLPLAVPVRR